MESRGFTIGVYVVRFGVTGRTVHRWVGRGILEREEKGWSHRQRYRFSEVVAAYLKSKKAMNDKGFLDRELMHPVLVARELGVSKATIYRWFSEGRFGGIKMGEEGRNGMVRIFRDEFEEYMRESVYETRRERRRRGVGD